MSLLDEVSHGYADSGGDVRIHYAALGEGPLVVMIHGFPDFWYTWRNQMEALAKNYRVLAIDQRGYNLSDQPDSVDNYAMKLIGPRRRSRHSQAGAVKGDGRGS